MDIEMIDTVDIEDIEGISNEQTDKPYINPITRVRRDNETLYTNNIGQYKIKTLFLEYRSDEYKALYTLKDEDYTLDNITYLSLRRLYLEAEDLTEYTFATKYFKNYDHWTRLCDSAWFRSYIQTWRTELELKIKAEALSRLLEEARDGGRNQYQANRFLIEKGWIDKQAEGSRRGRPSKAEIARKAAEEVFSSNRIKEDMKRLEIN